MRRILDAERSGDGIVGEEYGVKEGVSGRQWVLDPIDGTRSFTAGRAIFGTLIALVEEGWPMLGIIDQPVQRERWLGAAGRPTTLNAREIRTRPCATLEGALLATTSPHAFTGEEADGFLALVAAVSGGHARQGPIYGGDCYNYGLLAAGQLRSGVRGGAGALRLRRAGAGGGGRGRADVRLERRPADLGERRAGAGDRRSGADRRGAGGAARPRAWGRPRSPLSGIMRLTGWL